jgi:hypothetical protein
VKSELDSLSKELDANPQDWEDWVSLEDQKFYSSLVKSTKSILNNQTLQGKSAEDLVLEALVYPTGKLQNGVLYYIGNKYPENKGDLVKGNFPMGKVLAIAKAFLKKKTFSPLHREQTIVRSEPNEPTKIFENPSINYDLTSSSSEDKLFSHVLFNSPEGKELLKTLLDFWKSQGKDGKIAKEIFRCVLLATEYSSTQGPESGISVIVNNRLLNAYGLENPGEKIIPWKDLKGLNHFAKKDDPLSVYGLMAYLFEGTRESIAAAYNRTRWKTKKFLGLLLNPEEINPDLENNPNRKTKLKNLKAYAEKFKNISKNPKAALLLGKVLGIVDIKKSLSSTNYKFGSYSNRLANLILKLLK